MGQRDLDLSDSGQRQMTGSFKQKPEPSSSIKSLEFCEHLSKYQLPKKDYAKRGLFRIASQQRLKHLRKQLHQDLRTPYASCNCFLLSCRVQETDGSFFESFTALSWKQENRRLMAMQEVEGRAEDSPPSELSVGIKIVENRIHKKEVGITDFLLVSQGDN